MKISALYSTLLKIRCVLLHLKKVFMYLPLIWNDQDGEFNYILRLLKFKLHCMRSYFISVEDGLEIANEINFAEILVDKILDGDYSRDDWNNLFNYLRDKMENWWD